MNLWCKNLIKNLIHLINSLNELSFEKRKLINELSFEKESLKIF